MHRNISSAHVYFDEKEEMVRLGSQAPVLVKKYWEAKYKQLFIGEWFYLAPEVVAGHEYEQSADMWGLGMILLEMVCRNVKKPGYDPDALQKQRVFTPEMV